MQKIILALLALFGSAAASCPNSCSGHGTCGTDDTCTCYQGWGMGDEVSGDCSEQFCPYELAFVDSPDGAGMFHKYMECSGKGICDRSTGDCECFDGYAGKGCQRMACPNDCSGHGVCQYIEELGFGAVPGEYETYMGVTGFGLSTTSMQFAENAGQLWDWHKSMACVCDPSYTDVDCSRRMCPKGNDVMDERMNLEDKLQYQVQNITLYAAGASGNGTESRIKDFYNRTFALTFKSLLNETYTTIPIHVPMMAIEMRLAETVGLALKSLPNKVISNVNVNCSVGYEVRGDINENNEADGATVFRSETIAYLNLEIRFTGTSVQGKQNLLMVKADRCHDGCTPKLTGIDLMSVVASDESVARDLSFVAEKQASDYNNYECGRRGKCDYDSGICECFEGYTGEGCSIQTALV